MAYDTNDRLLNSEVAYQILRELHSQNTEEGMYAKELAESLDKSRNSIANYLKILRDSGLVERTKRTQAQYYDIDFDGVSTFWYEELMQRFESFEKEVEEEIEGDDFQVRDEFSEETRQIAKEYQEALPSEIREIRDKFSDFYQEGNYQNTEKSVGLIQLWSEWYFDQIPESTLEEILFKDLQEGLEYTISVFTKNSSLDHEELHPSLLILSDFLNLITGSYKKKRIALGALLMSSMASEDFFHELMEKHKKLNEIEQEIEELKEDIENSNKEKAQKMEELENLKEKVKQLDD